MTSETNNQPREESPVHVPFDTLDINDNSQLSNDDTASKTESKPKTEVLVAKSSRRRGKAIVVHPEENSSEQVEEHPEPEDEVEGEGNLVESQAEESSGEDSEEEVTRKKMKDRRTKPIAIDTTQLLSIFSPLFTQLINTIKPQVNIKPTKSIVVVSEEKKQDPVEESVEGKQELVEQEPVKQERALVLKEEVQIVVPEPTTEQKEAAERIITDGESSMTMAKFRAIFPVNVKVSTLGYLPGALHKQNVNEYSLKQMEATNQKEYEEDVAALTSTVTVAIEKFCQISLRKRMMENWALHLAKEALAKKKVKKRKRAEKRIMLTKKHKKERKQQAKERDALLRSSSDDDS